MLEFCHSQVFKTQGPFSHVLYTKDLLEEKLNEMLQEVSQCLLAKATKLTTVMTKGFAGGPTPSFPEETAQIIHIIF